MDAGAGLVRMGENRMRRRRLDAILTGNMARVALKMGVHRPTTPEEPAKNQKRTGNRVSVMALFSFVKPDGKHARSGFAIEAGSGAGSILFAADVRHSLPPDVELLFPTSGGFLYIAGFTGSVP